MWERKVLQEMKDKRELIYKKACFKAIRKYNYGQKRLCKTTFAAM